MQFVGSASVDVPTDVLAERITAQIGFELGAFREQKSFQDAFAYLRLKTEESGIFVLLLGNLGSYHTNISVNTFRGYAIADEIAPLIIINDQDAQSAWSFTVLHEMAHVWLGATGVSGWSPEVQLEQYCNDVASEILLPKREDEDLARIRIGALGSMVDELSAFAGRRRISRAMVAYRLFRLGRIEQKLYDQLRARLREDWLAHKEREALKQKRQEGGPSYYVVKRHRLGTALLGLATRSLGEGVLTHTKAGQLLGVKPRNVDPLLFGHPSDRGER